MLFSATNYSHAIVNVGDLRASEKTDGYNTTIDLSTNGASGNSEFSVINAGARAQFVYAENTYLLVTNYSYGKSRGETNVDKSFLHGRYIRSLDAIFAGEMFIQTQYNKLAQLSSRNFLGGGIRYLYLQDSQKTNSHNIFLGAGAFYEKEKLTVQSLNNSNDDGIRLNFYAVINFKINKTLRLMSTT